MGKSLGVIFDMDGVLIDSGEAHFEAFHKMGEKLGVPFTRELFKKTFGSHNNEIFPRWLGKPLAPEVIQKYADEKEQMYREIAPRFVKQIDGADRLVRSLHKAGFSIAVGSSGPKQNVEFALKLIGLRPMIHVLSTGDDVKQGKPDPAIFLNAAQKLGIAPERCLVIEDALQGLEAAARAGMRAAAITSTRKRNELTSAALVVDRLDELGPEVIERLLTGRK